MSNYRRLRVPGGTYFFTVRLQDPRCDLLVRRVGLLRSCFAATKLCKPFHIDAAVILPNRLHMIWTLPEGDSDYPNRWSMIKGTFSRHLPEEGRPRDSQIAKGERGIWQRRYWEHLLRDDADLQAHLHCIRMAPVEAGLVARPEDWPYSSFNVAAARKVGPVPPYLRTTGPVPSAQGSAIAGNAM